ncbi:hypothetical protein BgiMline_012028, partial [Biomphalaria glabrata]
MSDIVVILIYIDRPCCCSFHTISNLSSTLPPTKAPQLCAAPTYATWSWKDTSVASAPFTNEVNDLGILISVSGMTCSCPPLATGQRGDNQRSRRRHVTDADGNSSTAILLSPSRREVSLNYIS